MKVYNLYAHCTGFGVVIRDNNYHLTIDDATWLTEEDALKHQQKAKEIGLNCHIRQVDEDVVKNVRTLIKNGNEQPNELQPEKIFNLLLAE